MSDADDDDYEIVREQQGYFTVEKKVLKEGRIDLKKAEAEKLRLATIFLEKERKYFKAKNASALAELKLATATAALDEIRKLIDDDDVSEFVEKIKKKNRD